MAAPEKVDWDTCAEADCIGVRLPSGGKCWAHADEHHLDAALERLGEDPAVDARGVQINAELQERILDALPHTDDRPVVVRAQFDGATFEDVVLLGGATFEGEAVFVGATFHSRVLFGGATFQREAEFDRATFTGGARFDGATFMRGAGFSGATFQRWAGFNGTTFQRGAGFDRAKFQGGAEFDGATFSGEVSFYGATFDDLAEFNRTTFTSAARFNDATFQHKAGFDGAVFQDVTEFEGATFQGEAEFSAATVESWASFSNSTFHGVAQFTGARFPGGADFAQATFHALASFALATFEDYADFQRATFKDDAEFEQATFKYRAAFHGSTFEGWAGFGRVTFESGAEFGATFLANAWFAEAVFQGGAFFGGASFAGRAVFGSVIFEQARMFGPLFARELVLDYAVFRARVQVEVVTAALCARRAQFPAGVQFRLRWASVVFDDADLAAPAVLVGAPPFDWFDEEHFARRMRRLPPVRVRDGRPRLLSLRRADVAGLTVSNADLRACRFLGAHNLDRLRIEGEDSFAATPGSGFSYFDWSVMRGPNLVPANRAARLTIAEEQHWRAAKGWKPGRESWYGSDCAPPGWLRDVEVPTPTQVAGLYRALRKGREDSKDEPGAADFYYGEMEMRRQAHRQRARQSMPNEKDWGVAIAAQTEHAILWLYWLTSGYGLRAWRALASFLVLLVVAAGLFAYGGGFASTTTDTAAPPTATTLPTTTSPPSTTTTTAADTSFGGALVYSARTVIGLNREPQPRLTRFGDVVQILLRILGPVLLGLAVLSVRGRVKR
jgi:hypothetical protein